jgi:hypothetical protein
MGFMLPRSPMLRHDRRGSAPVESAPVDGRVFVAVAAVEVVLDEQTRRRLSRTAASARARFRAVLRAKIVLAAADGTSNPRIAADLHIGVDTVRKWRRRFTATGLAGLSDAKRTRPRRRPCACRNLIRPGPDHFDHRDEIRRGNEPPGPTREGSTPITARVSPAVLLRLAYLGVTHTLALLRLLPMSDRAKDARFSRSGTRPPSSNGTCTARRSASPGQIGPGSPPCYTSSPATYSARSGC